MILPSSSSFEYDLKSLQRQEEKYNEFYYQKIKQKNDSPKMDNICYNNNYMNYNYNYNYNKDENNDYINTNPISNMKKINYNKFDKLNDIDVKSSKKKWKWKRPILLRLWK
jgi:hypothetical protein